MKYLQTIIIALLCSVLAFSTTACQVSQAKINTAVSDIVTVSGLINTGAAALDANIALLPAADAAVIQPYVAKILADSAELNHLGATYLSSPNAAVLAQISAVISDAATSNSAALLAVLQIKNPNSQEIAKAALAVLATSLALLAGYLATINVPVTPAAQVALKQLKASADRPTIQRGFTLAQNQGLVPQDMTLASSGF